MTHTARGTVAGAAVGAAVLVLAALHVAQPSYTQTYTAAAPQPTAVASALPHTRPSTTVVAPRPPAAAQRRATTARRTGPAAAVRGAAPPPSQRSSARGPVGRSVWALGVLGLVGALLLRRRSTGSPAPALQPFATDTPPCATHALLATSGAKRPPSAPARAPGRRPITGRTPLAPRPRPSPRLRAAAEPAAAAGPPVSDVIVVGAGVAGLCAAIALANAGKSVTVLEASDGVGGRVRSDVHPDGYILDRGFQIFLTGYPEAQRVLDYRALDLRPFYPGALVRFDGGFHRMADPVQRPVDSVLSLSPTHPIGGVLDKLRVGLLRLNTFATSWEGLLQREEVRCRRARLGWGGGGGSAVRGLGVGRGGGRETKRTPGIGSKTVASLPLLSWGCIGL